MHFSRENFFSAILFPVLICQALLFTISAMLKGHDWDKCPFPIQSYAEQSAQWSIWQKIYSLTNDTNDTEQSKMYLLKRGAQAWLFFFVCFLFSIENLDLLFFHFFQVCTNVDYKWTSDRHFSQNGHSGKDTKIKA